MSLIFFVTFLYQDKKVRKGLYAADSMTKNKRKPYVLQTITSANKKPRHNHTGVLKRINCSLMKNQFAGLLRVIGVGNDYSLLLCGRLG